LVKRQANDLVLIISVRLNSCISVVLPRYPLFRRCEGSGPHATIRATWLRFAITKRRREVLLPACHRFNQGKGHAVMQSDTSGVVHIVDDDAGMRKSLLMLAESASLVARGYESAEDFLAKGEPDHPGCIVLDLRMPGMSGIELLQRLRTDMNDIPVILISGHADVGSTVRGMKLGAVDLLQKPIEPVVLIEAIRRSLKLSQTLHHDRKESSSVRQRFECLTPREMELLTLLADGHSNKQIAVEMGISIKTVANHRANVMAKTAALNAADLARLFTIHRGHLGQGQQTSAGSKPSY
jgi:two-component system, LuxR family, response regulator FixJ